jgi:methylmalonyl-CoA mutase cobalamin-binding domain/chain
LFEQNEYFVPEVVVCADTMYAGIRILEPHLKNKIRQAGKITIGVVEGDTHDIGKNIVVMMLEAAGFEICDLGRNVPSRLFADRALETGADIIGISSLMTTTMPEMKNIIDDLRTRRVAKKPFVIVGGGPVSFAFAKSIGADGYAANAPGAVKLSLRLMKEKQGQ